MSHLRRTLPGYAQSIQYASNPYPPHAHAKKKTDHASERDGDDVQAQRRLHQEKLRALDAEDCIFLDETGVNIAMARHYARAPQGERVHPSKPVNKGKNMTILGALSLEGIMAAMTIAGSTDAQVVLVSVKTILAPAWRPGQVVFMDHLSAYQVEGVLDAIESAGARLEY